MERRLLWQFMKNVYRKGNLVYKINNNDTKWTYQLVRIMRYVDIPLVKFIPRGYTMRYIDGVDLEGDKPFKHTYNSVNDLKLNPIQRNKVIKLFKSIVLAGIKTTYTLADFTKRNVIMKKNTPYLIDYDVIVEGELNSDYIALFQKMLNYLEIPYKFDGDLERLYECLGRLPSGSSPEITTSSV